MVRTYTYEFCGDTFSPQHQVRDVILKSVLILVVTKARRTDKTALGENKTRKKIKASLNLETLQTNHDYRRIILQRRQRINCITHVTKIISLKSSKEVLRKDQESI